MRYPPFFDAVPRLRLRDPLADFLGALEGGIVEYSYLDAVKLAGHSCPTVAGAYGLTRRALDALWGGALAERGALRVEFRDAREAGTTGVVAQVVSLITGAAPETGFKGIGGRFARRDRQAFGVELPLEIRYIRTDTGAAVDGVAQLRQVPADPAMGELMQRSLAGQASPEETRRFGALWQDRVRRILLEHGDDPTVFILQPAA